MSKEKGIDSEHLHKADLVAKVLLMAERGEPQEYIRKNLEVSPYFIQSVIKGRKQTCRCGREFFPQKEGQRFGSHSCYGAAVKEISG